MKNGETANTVISFGKTKNQAWFDVNNIEIHNLIEAKKNARLTYEQDRRSSFKHFQKLTQTELRELQDIWCQPNVVELQGYANAHDLRNFYSETKQLFEPERTST